MSASPAALHSHTHQARRKSMLVRTLLVAVSLCAALAVAGVAVAPAKDGIKVEVIADPIPPITEVPLPFICRITFEGDLAFLDCHNTAPNPNPPKDAKTANLDCGGGPGKATAYPDGRVRAKCRLKASNFR
jgi:hypothetical protein